MRSLALASAAAILITGCTGGPSQSRAHTPVSGSSVSQQQQAKAGASIGGKARTNGEAAMTKALATREGAETVKAFRKAIPPVQKEAQRRQQEAESRAKQKSQGRPAHTADGQPIVYFTFDDGPSEYTPKVLEILKKHGAHATFFELGQQAQNRQDLVKRVRSEGNTIGNHSWDHPPFSRRSNERILKQINDAEAWLGPTTCVRPPYGDTTKRVNSVIHGTGRAVTLWDVDTEDWKRPGVDSIEKVIKDQVAPGKVILMHDGGGDRRQSVEALDRALTELEGQGYRFEALPECE